MTGKVDSTTGVQYGMMRVMQHAAIMHFGEFYDSPLRSVEEYVDNATDANARKIWVVRETRSVTIIDDGHGMPLDLMPEDQAMLELYRQTLESGEATEADLDFRQFVRYPESLKSLSWAMESIAFSGKAYRQAEEGSLRGRRGIGALSYRGSNDGTSMWYSRPSMEIARVYFGAGITVSDIPTYLVVPPTNEELQRGNRRYLKQIAPTPLADPDGNDLESGTRIEIPNLTPEAEASLEIDVLVAQLQKRFGEDIRQGRYQLMVVDRVSPRGRKASGGVTIPVPPAEFHGIRVLKDRTERPLFLKGGRGPFRIELYYNPERRGRSYLPMLRHRGVDIRPVNELPEFDVMPFNSGHFDGFIEFPNLPEQEAPWTTDKKTPREGPVRNQWQKAVNNLAPLIYEDVEEIEDRAKQDKVVETARQTSRALTEMLRTNEYVQQILRGTVPEASSKRSKSKKGTYQIPKSVIARVMDEHFRGVQGVEIKLKYQGKVIASKLTGPGGSVSFGSHDYGQYVFEMVPPEDVRLAKQSSSSHMFRLTEGWEGISYIFNVITGRPAPNRTKLNKIELVYRAWAQIDQPYRDDWFEVDGTLEINTESPAIKEAIELGNFEVVNWLAADYAACALSVLTDPASIEEAMLIQSQLFDHARRAIHGETSKPRSRKKMKV